MEKIIRTPTLEDDCDMITYIRNKGSNNVQTEFEQDSDNGRTEFEQDSDSVPTISVQRQDKNQTAVARGMKRPNETHKSVYQENKDIVKLLSNNTFIRVNTSGTYREMATLPLSKAPEDLTDAVNRCGYPVSRRELAKIYTAANVCQRVPRFKVWAISIFVCLMSVYITTVIEKIITNASTPTTLLASVTTSESPPCVDKMITEFERKNKFTFFPYRKDVIKKEINQSGDYSAANCEIILQQNMAAQIRATKKK